MSRFDEFKSVLEGLGTSLDSGTTLLDFGCGSGELVASAMSYGIDAYGCDLTLSGNQAWIDQEMLADLVGKGRLSEIISGGRGGPRTSPMPSDEYRLPFDACSFDVVISDQVLEHVTNFDEVARELHRVVKPGGVFLHMFPPRYSLVEAHVNVPFAGAFSPNWWLKLWARLGVRSEFQQQFTAEEAVDWNREFLDTECNYVPKSEMARCFRGLFEVRFVESEFFKVSRRARVFLHPALYSGLRSRVLYGVRIG